jgi:cation diffusion facilitator family transporter
MSGTSDNFTRMRNADLESPLHTLRKQRAMVISITAAVLLTAAKIIIAGITGSVAVLSEAAHSLTDLVAATITLLAIRRASSPPDTRHRYGHEKLENIAAAVEGLIILAAISWVIWTSLERLRFGGEVELPLAAAGIMVFSAVSNWLVARHLVRVGEATNSPAVRADGHQWMTDVYTSIAGAVGLIFVAITGAHWLDAAVALAVSTLVVRIGFVLVMDAVRVLADEGLPPDELRRIEAIVGRERTGVTGFHRLRTRRAGSRTHVDLHLTVNGSMPIWQAHEIAHEVEADIMHAIPNVDVLIHLEPDSAAPAPGGYLGPGDVR